MNTIELQQKIISEIKNTSDDKLLKAIVRLLQLGSGELEVYQLNEVQKKSIEVAREQIKHGNFLTDDEANQEIEEWLSK